MLSLLAGDICSTQQAPASTTSLFAPSRSRTVTARFAAGVSNSNDAYAANTLAIAFRQTSHTVAVFLTALPLEAKGRVVLADGIPAIRIKIVDWPAELHTFHCTLLNTKDVDVVRYCSEAENHGAVPYAVGPWDHFGSGSLINPVSLGWLTITDYVALCHLI
jgi:hypothetical protein